MPTTESRVRCLDCGNLTPCNNISRCWTCYAEHVVGLPLESATLRETISRHNQRCSTCALAATFPADDLEEEVSDDMKTKMTSVAYDKGYGFRVPKETPLGDVRSLWSNHVTNVSYASLIERPTQTAMKTIFTTGHVVAREQLLKVHEKLEGYLRGKRLALPGIGPKPTYTDSPDFNLIKYIGIELEGGWYADRVAEINARVKSDGSVHIVPRHRILDGRELDEVCDAPDCDNPECIVARSGVAASQSANGERRRGQFRVGEVEFGPVAPSAGIAWDHFFRLYPEEVNDTCGQHVHVSFPSSGIYGAFVREDFRPWLMNGLHKWATPNRAEFPAHFWKRLDGAFVSPGNGGNYCQAKYDGAAQLINGGDRYTQVNYCLRKHGTMEIRVLPMFDNPEQSKAAIEEVVRLVAVWAKAFAPRPKKPIVVAASELSN